MKIIQLLHLPIDYQDGDHSDSPMIVALMDDGTVWGSAYNESLPIKDSFREFEQIDLSFKQDK